MEMEITNNIEKQQFEYRIGDQIARLEYRYYKKSIAFMHTVVPNELAGKGIASALAKEAFSFAKISNKSVMVYCPFVGHYMKKHPEFKEQLNREFHQ